MWNVECGMWNVECGMWNVGVVATFAYTAIITYLLLKLVDKLLVLRVDEEQELQGVDLVEHDEKGYDL